MVMTFRRRWLPPLLVSLTVVAALAGYVAAVITPEVGSEFRPAEYVANVNSADSKPLWTFGFVGDTQLGEAITPVIFQQMRAAGVEFALHLGDLVDEAASDDEWERLIADAEAEQIRLLPVVGNHDRLRDRSDTGETRWRQYFPQLHGTFYHFRHRGLNFVMLNSERSLIRGSEQEQFLRWQLEHHPGPTIVCLHRPVFSSGSRDWPAMLARRLWVHGAVRESDVVAVLAGHNHFYDRSLPLDGVTYVVSGGGSSKLYAAETPAATSAKFVAGRNHFGLVDVYADHLAVRAIDLTGVEFDRFALPLPATSHEPGTAANRLAMELPSLAETLAPKQPLRITRRRGATSHD